MGDEENLPGKTDTSAVTHAVTEDLARNHMVVDEDRVQLLNECQRGRTNFVDRTTHRLVEVLGQVRQVQVGRSLVALGLESRVEALTSEANLVPELIETSDALLRVGHIGKLGETESGGS